MLTIAKHESMLDSLLKKIEHCIMKTNTKSASIDLSQSSVYLKNKDLPNPEVFIEQSKTTILTLKEIEYRITLM